MFEELQAEEKGEKEERGKMMKITAIIAGVIVLIGVIVYFSSGSHATSNQATQTHAAAGPVAPADPVKDLTIVKAVMGKDPTGLRVMWSVQLHNQSQVYTYHAIKYQAQLIGADGSILSTTQDVINNSIAPGDDKEFPEFMGGVYNEDASTYNFKIVDAASTKQ